MGREVQEGAGVWEEGGVQGRGGARGAGGGGRCHLGQEGCDEHEEDVVDEQHEQQQRAGLDTARPSLPGD